MHECTSIIMNSFHLFLIFSLYVFMLFRFFLNKGFIIHRGGGRRGWVLLKSKREQTKERGGWGVGSNLFQTFFMPCKYFYCYRIYICVNNIVIFERKRGNSLERAYIEGGQESHIKCKWMNKGKDKNYRFRLNVFFEWPQSLFAATNIYDLLIFNLAWYLISL